ncbi:bifunctional hydroxymethylpyrimidine kinase/phosphomethylpyrimidine kinase [Gordonia sp. zg691]|uniref:PfkB family carbohydrate kinase n=1 Tax=Gordonia jinghuaiqii TaxID=2758710 RepID=UPI00166245D6|nr:PfkB family carbohydrate kinase [Gordonia jinghuaiqii]MBD0863647.1 bifunctional hydroxymethylpyrimidine kinase/phosphomethylpyrimidine kinase [Gordonia jinghuaiqii]
MTGTRPARLLVVGAVNVDLVVAAQRLPGPGETVVGPGVAQHGGGKGANAAVAAARAGAEVRFCGAVGADAMGTGALDELRVECIDVTDVRILAGTATGTALIVVDPKGENQIAVGAGANAEVDPTAVRRAVVRAADWAGCVLVSTEIPPSAVRAVVETAALHGLPCVLNPAPVFPGIVDLLAHGPVVTPNRTELEDLYGLLPNVDDSPSGTSPSVNEMAAAIASVSHASVLVTLGAEGAVVVEPSGETTTLPPGRIDEVRDTTGAGDTLNGVLAGSLAGGASLTAAALRGVAAASMSVAHVGARAGMPRAESLVGV